MAPKKVKNPRKSAKYYRSNDEARKKKMKMAIGFMNTFMQKLKTELLKKYG
jgi:hypothetical protein